jgi:hypothetical protein
MTIQTNLPINATDDSATDVRNFFDNYFTNQLNFPSELIDATVGFFEKRGFEGYAARSTAAVLLQQAKLDNVKVFELLDSLGNLSEVQLSSIVAEVLNYNRQKTSTLGYRSNSSASEFLERRNIVV